MKHLNQIFNRYSRLTLLLIFIIAVSLRWLYLPSNAISFAYDQARDAFLVQDLLAGHLKILGPPVSGVPGLFHGVLYYYVIAPAYLLSKGNPVGVAYFLSFVSSLVVFVAYYFTFVVTKNKFYGLLSALFLAFSFESTQYANLMTNASMGVWFVPVMYLSFYLWLTKKNNFFAGLTGLAFGLAVQSEVALLYHLFPLSIWIFVMRKEITKKDLVRFFSFFVFGVLPMIISEFKFGFKSVGALHYLLSSKDGISEGKMLTDYVATLLNQSGKTFAYSIFPINIIYGGVVGFLMLALAFREKDFAGRLIGSGILAYAFALPFGGWNMRHILVGVSPLICVLMAITLWKYFNKQYAITFIVVTLVLLTNFNMILSENKNGQTIFPLQMDLVLGKELSAIDYTYKEAAGENFSISTLTSPLFVNTLWSYLYNWYGVKSYGYLPTWVGRDQVGQLGDNLKKDIKAPIHYFIKEPTFGIPDLWVTYAKGDQDAMSNFVKEEKFGDIIVQKRRPF